MEQDQQGLIQGESSEVRLLLWCVTAGLQDIQVLPTSRHRRKQARWVRDNPFAFRIYYHDTGLGKFISMAAQTFNADEISDLVPAARRQGNLLRA